jgi:hypothetical protein
MAAKTIDCLLGFVRITNTEGQESEEGILAA